MPRSSQSKVLKCNALAIHRSRHLITPFRLLRPSSFTEARRMLDDVPKATPMAGGLDVITGMKTGTGPSVIVWLGRVPGTGDPVVDGDTLVLPARCSHDQLVTSAIVADAFPDLVAAWSHLANIRIRNQGTIVGNVMAGVAGYEAAVLLAAARAKLAVLAPGGREHLIDVSDLSQAAARCSVPWLVTAVHIPLRERASENLLLYDRSLRPTLSVALGLEMNDGMILRARAVLGGYGPAPIVRELPLGGVELDSMEGQKNRIANDAFAALPPLLSSWRGEAGYPASMARILLCRLLGDAR